MDSNEGAMEVRKRIFGLDLMRAVAVLLVLFAHTFEFILPDTDILLNRLFGFLGVELFFVLSGFLIGRILIKIFNKGSFTFREMRHFWIRRWFRTLPNYYLCLVLYLLFYYGMSMSTGLGSERLLSYVFFLQNSVQPHPGFFAVAWSLSIEEWFYLSFPVVLYVVHAITQRKNSSILITIGLYVVLCLSARCGLSIIADLSWSSWFRKMIFWRLDAIAIGVGVAYLYTYFYDVLQRNKNIIFISGIILLTGLLIPFWSNYVVLGETHFFQNTFFFTLASLGFAALLPYLAFWEKTSYHIFGKIITFISLTSYSMYLLHYMVVIFFFHHPVTEMGWLTFLTVWGISFLISWLMYRFYEVPITSLRERFSVRED